MNTTMYTSAEAEEKDKISFSKSIGAKLDDYFTKEKAYYCDSTEQIVAETQMIWTQVNV